MARGTPWGWIVGIGAAVVAAIAWAATRSSATGTQVKVQVDTPFWLQPSPDLVTAGNAVLTVPAGSVVLIADGVEQSGGGAWTACYLPGRGARLYWTQTANLVQIA